MAAVRSVYPDAGRSTETLLRAPTLPSPDRLADSLLHDLVALPGPLILVLDDYHMIQTVDVQVAMARLVQHMPAHVHLVLTTRADPPLPLERLRGRQQLVEIRSADLRFTPRGSESAVAADARRRSGRRNSGPAWRRAQRDGPLACNWPLFPCVGRSDPVAFAKKIAQSSHQLVADYLLAEVLEGLPRSPESMSAADLVARSFLRSLVRCDPGRGKPGTDRRGLRPRRTSIQPLSRTAGRRGDLVSLPSSLPAPAAQPAAAALFRRRDQGHARPRQHLVRGSWPA